MRLIDADEIRIKSEYMHDICGSVMIRVEDVARIINEMPTIDPQPQWIPCSERLPNTEVLCCDKYGEMIIAYVYADDRSDTGFSAESEPQCIYGCVAWCPLPESYKKKE